jgi:hypothetical protein
VKRALIAVVVLALVGASAALATKPGSGSDNGQARVFVPTPVQDLGNQDLTDQKEPTTRHFRAPIAASG